MNAKKIITLFLLIAGICSSSLLSAQTEQQRKKNNNVDNNGLVLQGYDVVSYFTSTSPKKGNKNYSFTYKGLSYYFASEASLNIFKTNPEKWEPAYGGWCAYAMGNTGEKVEVDPSTFKIIDGRLYLFYNSYFNNTLPKWNKDEMNLKTKADKNWTTIQSK